MIGATNKQTRMAIYGIGSTKRFTVTKMGTSATTPAAAAVQGCLLARENADQLDTAFLTKKIWTFSQADRFDSIQTSPIVIEGPAILKLQVISDTVNTICTGSIEGFIVSKQN